MAKEITSIAILVALLVLAMVDTGVVNRKTDTLIEELEEAKDLYAEGERQEAQSVVINSFKSWHEWDSYASVMLRHAEEVDTVTAAYYELIEKLESNEQVAPAAFEMMVSNLKRLSNTGKLSIGALL